MGRGNFLKMFPLFERADSTSIKAICQACRTMRTGKGDIVVELGQSNEDMYMIVRGEVLMLKQQRKLGMLSEEDWFGERALFFEGLVHHVSMRCETDCEFLVLGRNAFLQQVAVFPRLQDEYQKLVQKLTRAPSISLLTNPSAMVSSSRTSINL